jgi:hypothetical protein
MTAATISPEIVQLALGLGNLISAQWLAIRGLSGQATTEDIEMFARKGVFSSMGRAGAVATVVAMALTAVEPSTAFAGSSPQGKGMTASSGISGATDISARRRYYRGGGAAAAAAFAGIVGTGLAIAAAQNRRDYYYDNGYGYGGGYYDAPPAYYGGGPVYYGGGPYYGGGGYYGSTVPHFRGHPIASW